MPVFPSVIQTKQPATGTSIFAVMSKMAQEHQAINLSQGFPDFSPDEELVALVHEKMKKGFNQYAPMPGLLSLREAIAEKTESRYGIAFNPDTEITITAGATQAIYAAITAIIREGDEVVIFEPAYDCYQPAIELNGGIPVYIGLKYPGYTIDWEEVKKRINHRTKALIINTPHNPTGAILTAKDMRELEKIVKDTDILIISDEVYEHIVFDGQEHESVLKYPHLAERSFAVYSFGKTYHCTGWKMGCVLAPASLTKELRKIHQFLVFSCNTPIQHALADFMRKSSNYYPNLPGFFQQKRDFFLGQIKGSRFKFTPARGTYFQLLDYSEITGKKDTAFAEEMTKKYGVAPIPVSAFYHENTDNKVLRFCFAKSEDILREAAEKLCGI